MSAACLMLVLQLSQSHVESAKKSERVGAAWARKKAAAREGGHKVSARAPGWLALVNGEFVPIDDRVRVVKDVFRWTIEGAGRREIARRLNTADPPVLPFKHAEKRRPGRPPPTGWHASAVAKILKNRAVLGEYQPGKGSHKSRNYKPDGDPIPDYYPRIIDDETFWQAEGASQRRRTGAAGPRGNVGSHMLKGLVRCAACGGPMHVLNKGAGPKGGVYLACSAAHRSAGCSMSRRWRVDRLESDVLHALEYLEPSTLFNADGSVTRALARVQSLKARLEAADAVRKRLLAAVRLSDDEDAAADFAEQAEVVKALRKELKGAEAEAAMFQADPGLAARLADASSLSLQLDEADDEKRRELRIRLNETLRGLVERIAFSDDLGAVMEMKPWLGQKRFEGRVPFATVIAADGDAGAMVGRVLLERDPEAAKRFVMGDDGEAWWE
jgi:hypothetical protein